jgi:hypothetical protein
MGSHKLFLQKFYRACGTAPTEGENFLTLTPSLARPPSPKLGEGLGGEGYFRGIVSA